MMSIVGWVIIMVGPLKARLALKALGSYCLGRPMLSLLGVGRQLLVDCQPGPGVLTGSASRFYCVKWLVLDSLGLGIGLLYRGRVRKDLTGPVV